MTLLETALQIKTDEARQVWFDSLSEDDRKEFSSELSEAMNGIVSAFQPIIEAIQNAMSVFLPLVSAWCLGYEAAQKEIKQS